MARPSTARLLLVLAMVVAACDPAVVPTGTTDPTSATSVPPSPASPRSSAPATDQPAGAEATWQRQSSIDDLPEARHGHTWTVDPSDAAAYLFGGRDQRESFADVWRYDLGADRWDPLQPAGAGPRPRSGHAAAWSDDLGVIVFGGEAEDGTPLDDLWAYAPMTGRWRQLATSGARPPARASSCAVLGPDGRLWLGHGLAADGPLDDIWAYDIEGDAWTRATPAGPGPSARGSHGCWSTAAGSLMLYGGRAASTTFGDAWTLAAPGTDDAAWTRSEPDVAPGVRSEFAWTRFNDRIVIFGGRGASGDDLDDLIAFDVVTLGVETFVALGDPPDGRVAAALAEDPAGERVIMFGGAVDGRDSTDFWSVMLP